MNIQLKVNRQAGRAVWTAAIALIALAAAQAVSAQGRPCNNATLNGLYGGQMQGTLPTPPTDPFYGATQSVIGVMMRSYDGNGNFEMTDNIKGSLTGIVPDRPGFGTYEVFSDCTATTRFQPDANNPNVVIEERMVILDNGNETLSITAFPPPVMVSAVSRRVNQR